MFFLQCNQKLTGPHLTRSCFCLGEGRRVMPTSTHSTATWKAVFALKTSSSQCSKQPEQSLVSLSKSPRCSLFRQLKAKTGSDV